jgi:hypothetical protein
MKTPIKPIAFIVILILNINILMAQPEQDEDIEDVPADAGISILASAGVIYGVKRLSKKNFIDKKSTTS